MIAIDQSIEMPPTLWSSTPLTPIHHGVISVHHAKEGYDYPTIHLPHTLSKLAGLPTRIYQTLHDGALAFLVVVSSADKTAETRVKKSTNDKFNLKASVLTWRRSPVRIRPSPSFFLRSDTLEPSIGHLTETRILSIGSPVASSVKVSVARLVQS